MNSDFVILHHSYRLKWASGKNLSEILHEDGIDDWQYIVYNLVFRASNELKEMCLKDTQKWKEGRVCIDTEKYDEYIDSISIDWNYNETLINGEKCYPVTIKSSSNIDKSSLFVNGYIENFSPFLVYHEKFDVFQFKEYLQYNPATMGILKFIDELKNDCSYGIAANYSQFYSCLKALEGFWD